jgi:glycerophosphoryl diester phosphodiesterase
VEIVTKKRMMLFSGTAHPELAAEIADQLGVSLAPSKISRFAGGEIYVWTVDEVRRIRALEALGVDGVITNDPRLFDSPEPGRG